MKRRFPARVVALCRALNQAAAAKRPQQEAAIAAHPFMKIGRPKHFEGIREGWTACGINNVTTTTCPQLTDCYRCRRTYAWKIARDKSRTK